jgi:uncharacterized membrane protein HdeD (DUF308 family)
VPPWRDGVHWPLFALAVPAGALLLVDSWIALQAQIHRTDELARTTAGFATNVEHLLGIFVAMLFVTSPRPGRKPLVVMVAAELLYLGVVAFTVPNAPGSWGAFGGALSLLAGLAYLPVLANEFRQRRRLAAPLPGSP